MPDTTPLEEDAWPRGWEGHEKAQLLRMARLSFAEKLEWLDQANRLVRYIEKHRRQRNDPVMSEAMDRARPR